MLTIQNQRLCDAKHNSVMQKTSKAKPRPTTLSKSLKVKAGPTAMEKVLKQNLCKVVIYENKPRPAAKGHSGKEKYINMIRSHSSQFFWSNQHQKL